MIKLFLKQTPFGISVIILSIAVFFLALVVPVLGRQTLIVRSGSMAPTIATGDLVAITSKPSYQKGDIITFRNPQNSNVLITHRIAKVNTNKGEVTYLTKGDANTAADNFIVPSQTVVGKADYSVKKLGKILAFSKTKNGFLTFAVLPAVFVIALESTNILKELKKSKKKKHQVNPMGVAHASASFQSLLKTWSYWSKSTSWNLGKHININNRGISVRAFLPITAALVILGSTYATYMDGAVSNSNVFSAAEIFPTPSVSPTPTPSESPSVEGLVINEFVANPTASSDEWIELYNSGSTTIDLTDWKLTDAASHVRDLTSLGNIAPGNFKVLETPEGFLNNSGSDTLYLKNSSDTIVDSHTYTGTIAEEKSIGRDADGTGNFKTCGTSTKGTTNNGSC